MARKPSPLMDDATTSRLAREVARDIKSIKEILTQFQLTEDQFEAVADSKFFQVRLAEEMQLWTASDPLTIRGRVEIKAATMVEDMLLEAYALFHDRNQPMQAKVEMLKWAARVAGIGEASGAKGNSDGQVRITINVGSTTLAFDKEKSLPGGVTGVSDVVDLTPSNAG